MKGRIRTALATCEEDGKPVVRSAPAAKTPCSAPLARASNSMLRACDSRTWRLWTVAQCWSTARLESKHGARAASVSARQSMVGACCG